MRDRECLDISGASHSAGKHIINWPCGFTDSQKLKFEDAGDGWYRIRFKHSGLYVAVPDNSSKGNWRLVQWSATGAEDQQFRVQPNSAGTYNIWTRRGKVLTLSSHHECPKAVWDGLCKYDEYLTQHGENEQSTNSARFWFDRVDIEDPTDFGHADRRWMMDHDGDGKDDFCRAVGESSGKDSYLGCSRSTDTGIGGAITTHVPIADWGHAGRRWMVDFNGDGKSDFCRAVGNSSGKDSFLGCSLSTASAPFAGPLNMWAPVADWGHADRRWMADVNGDGKADFCRAVGNSSGAGSFLGCSFSTGSGLDAPISVWIPIADWGHADRRWLADFNGDGKADFCRAVGNSSGAGSFLGCSLSTASAPFAGPIEMWSPVADWGHADRRWLADFNGDRKADFCRAVGNSGGAESWLGCSPSTGSALSSTIDVWTAVPIWGPAGLRFMADVKGQGRAELVFQSPYNGSVLLHTAPM